MAHDLPPEALAQAAANENRGEHRRPNPAQVPGERNYRRPKRRFNPRGNRRAA